MKNKIFTGIVLSVLCLIGSGSDAAEERPIKIGFISPLTGSVAANAKDQVDSFMMCIEEAGSRVAGRPIKVIIEDDATKPAVGLSKARKLVTEDKVHILAGALLGNVAAAITPYIREQKIPFVISAASPADLTQRDYSPYVLRPTFAGGQLMHPFGEWVYKNLKVRKVVTMGLDYTFGHDNIQAFHRTFEEAGGKVIQMIWTPMNALDLAPYMAQINRDADAIFALYLGSFSLRFAKQFEEAGLKGKMIVLGGPTLTDESALRFMGDEALDYISASNWSGALDTPNAKKFVEEYRKRFKVVPSYNSEMNYSLGRWLIEGIKAVNGNVEDSAKLFAAMRKMKVTDAPRGSLELDDYNNAIQSVYVRKVQKVGGELQNTVIATIPNVGQFWTYDPKKFMQEPSYSHDYPPCRFCK